MIRVFELDESRSILIFTTNNKILFRVRQGDYLGKTRILASDYYNNLNGWIYQNAIFYCYEAINHTYIIRNANENSIYGKIESFHGQPVVLIHKGEPYLLFLKQIQNERILCCWEAINKTEKELIKVPECKEFEMLVNSNTRILILTAEKKHFFWLNQNLDIEEIFIEDIGKTKQMEKELNQTKQALLKAKMQYEELMDVAQKYRDEAIRWQSKFM